MTPEEIIKCIRDIFGKKKSIGLHEPIFAGKEREYVVDAVDSTFVSSVGPYVTEFENVIADFCEAEAATATVNGTAALHTALLLSGVKQNDLVVTQALTFVATCNAIRYCGAEPAFVDVSPDGLGMSPNALEVWLDDNCTVNEEGECIHAASSRCVRACLPMHTFGHPCGMVRLSEICAKWNINLVDDAAEALGSKSDGRPIGNGKNISILSFNGNKTITTGGGGMILTDRETAQRAKHLTTTAKLAGRLDFYHDELGFNYRMPNINAALGCAQMEKIAEILQSKRRIAAHYREFFAGSDFQFLDEPTGCKSNFWLNAVICQDEQSRDELVAVTNAAEIYTRPAWLLMTDLPMFAHCSRGDLSVSQWHQKRLVNLPSSPKVSP
ncbi:LegC family aminotransferase [Alphaproteobacteria bacterium]|nr:LegC family aminotransferase [Alphaproteobacteria bacterium]